MTLTVDLVRTDLSAKCICFCWRNLWSDCHVTHTPKCNGPAKIWKNYCCITTLIVSLFSLCCLPFTTQLRFGTVDKMAGIFTKRTWQPYRQCLPWRLV